jgi:hypothetical protein
MSGIWNGKSTYKRAKAGHRYFSLRELRIRGRTVRKNKEKNFENFKNYYLEHKSEQLRQFRAVQYTSGVGQTFWHVPVFARCELLEALWIRTVL